MKKSKIFRIIFILSFVPYIVLLLISIYYAINGYDVYTWILPVYKGTIYGWEAFKEIIFWYGISMCIIPGLRKYEPGLAIAVAIWYNASK